MRVGRLLGLVDYPFLELEPRFVGIVGSRGYECLHHVQDLVDALPPKSCIVTGDAKGIDTYAYHLGKKSGNIPIRVTACWEAHGRGAGPRRNPVIIELSNIVLAFWDGKSTGTLSSMTLAYKACKPCYVMIDDPCAHWQVCDEQFLERYGWTP